MKRALIALLLATLLAFTPPARAQKPQPEDFRDTLSQATLALYAGKQSCRYVTYHTFFGDIPNWECGFETQFTCTATVVASDGKGNYVGLTTGHCFDYDQMTDGYKYYVSDSVKENPVIKQIQITKFENNTQYDYGIFRFNSSRTYPVIKVQGMPGSDASDTAVPPIGTRILNANFSLGVVKEVTEGVIVSKQVGEEESPRGPRLRRRYFVQMPFGPGASGSPVVDENTHVIVGLLEGTFPDTQMAAVVMPVGKNLQDFIEDDSVGLKPLPAPKTPEGKPAGEGATIVARLRSLFSYYEHKE